MDNNYFDFLGQNSIAGNDNSNAGSNNDKGKVNLTVRVDADCQVVCDGDFLFLANANQIVKDKAPMGQHLLNFTSLDYPDATIEKIVDFPVEGNNYLIVVNNLKEKVEILQKEKEAEKQAKQRAEELERQKIGKEKERELELDKAMALFRDANYRSAVELFEKHIDYLNSDQHNAYSESYKNCLYTVVLEKYENKTKVINLIKNTLDLGLMESTDFVATVPVIIKKEILKDEAEELKVAFEDAGAVVTIQLLESIVANGVPFQMIYVKGGTYMFGKYIKRFDDGDKYIRLGDQVRKVTVNDFYIGKYVVTQNVWKAVMGSEPTFKGGWTNEIGLGDNYPAYRVTWNECQEFIGKLNKLTGRRFRLPTEAEWEFAFRGGNYTHDYEYSGSYDVNKVAWYNKNCGERLHEVGKLDENELGLCDMSGNVNEWCADWYEKIWTEATEKAGSNTLGSYLWKYRNEDLKDVKWDMKEAEKSLKAIENPKGPVTGSERVIRGGSYQENELSARLYTRNHREPERAGAFIGFRLALDV